MDGSVINWDGDGVGLGRDGGISYLSEMFGNSWIYDLGESRLKL